MYFKEVLVIYLSCFCVSVFTQDDMRCLDMKPPRNFALSEIMGLYFVVQIVHHRDDGRNKGTATVDSCPLVQLTRDGRSVTLLWNEQAGHVQYLFTVPNVETNPGFWMSTGPQNGSMLQKAYRQFAGTVQVVIVAKNHVVLTFCSPNSDLYSVVLSRDQKMRRVDLFEINEMLIKKDLKEVGIKEACRDSASSVTSSLLVLIAVFAVSRL
uniref:Lipocalin/cytosolic fatty-acid binding domain-containing protein n=1 Tax=Clastoptera arizonana TaxID=38151 RepID=A0A1B6CZF5_9HEMI